MLSAKIYIFIRSLKTVLQKKKKIQRKNKGGGMRNFEGDRYVSGTDCGDTSVMWCILIFNKLYTLNMLC